MRLIRTQKMDFINS